jgi:hypothetical protein
MTSRQAAKLDAVPYYRDIRLALDQPGCPFCRLLTQRADRYLDAVLWELVNDPGVRSDLNQARGYCQQHGWLLVRKGSALGIAILTRDVVRTLLEVVGSNPLDGSPASVLETFRRSLDPERVPPGAASLVAKLSPQKPCPACSHLASTERDCSTTLLRHFDGEGALSEPYRASDGLCLPHFRRVLARAPGGRTGEALVSAQEEVWQRLYAELGEFIRKKDVRFRDEPFGDERDSWRRALEAVSGAPPRAESERQGLTQSL